MRRPADPLSQQRRALKWVAFACVIAAAIALYPLAVPLCLAVWAGSILKPFARRVEQVLRGRHRSAAVVAVLLLFAIVAPATVLAVNLIEGVTELATVIAKPGDNGRLRALVQEDARDEASGNMVADTRQLSKLAKQHGSEAKDIGKAAFLFSALTAVFLFILAFGTYAVLAEGDKLRAWLLEHSPLGRPSSERLGAAFQETGRALLATVGITAVLQGVLCSVIFLGLGVPRAWVLGFLSGVFSVMPVVGTPLVWGPVAAGLYLSGETTKALILVLLGGGVIAIIENLVSPFFTRIVHFKLPTFILVASMFGGVLALGPAGLLLGPVILRLAQEAIALAREDGLVGRAQPPLM